jgi:hypothetical protein
MTKRGNVGMTALAGRKTREIPHIEPGQTYAEDKIIRLYWDTIIEKYSERN